MNTYIICAFPGCGKTTAYESIKHRIKCIDSDSSKFHGEGMTFPDDYIAHIKENIGKVEIIFASSHKEVRDALAKEKIPFILYFPTKNRRIEFVTNIVARGSKRDLVQKIDKNFDEWVDSIENDDNQYMQGVRLPEAGQFLGNEQGFVDLLNYILDTREKKDEQA